MLDIVQSFPLLSYCIVSPIYISPICNVEIDYSAEIIKLGILYFSLFTLIIGMMCGSVTAKALLLMLCVFRFFYLSIYRVKESVSYGISIFPFIRYMA